MRACACVTLAEPRELKAWPAFFLTGGGLQAECSGGLRWQRGRGRTPTDQQVFSVPWMAS